MPELKALVVDWGGVLTSGLGESIQAWARGDRIDYERFERTMREWRGELAGEQARFNPIYALERGELEVHGALLAAAPAVAVVDHEDPHGSIPSPGSTCSATTRAIASSRYGSSSPAARRA